MKEVGVKYWLKKRENLYFLNFYPKNSSAILLFTINKNSKFTKIINQRALQ